MPTAIAIIISIVNTISDISFKSFPNVNYFKTVYVTSPVAPVAIRRRVSAPFFV